MPGPAEFADYQRATVEENALAKSTAANRSNTLMYLKQLYGLRPDIPVFVALRELWDVKFSDQPILALLCASARDVLLRSTADAVLGATPGTPVAAADLSAGIAEAYPGRYKPSTLRNLGQNIASSWTQVGPARRSSGQATINAVGRRARRRLCDVPGSSRRPRRPRALHIAMGAHARPQRGDLRHMAEAAGRSGWLEYRSSGGMTEIGFRHLGRPDRLDGVLRWIALTRSWASTAASCRCHGARTLSGAERVWMAVYPPELERRVRAKLPDFDFATRESGHAWLRARRDRLVLHVARRAGIQGRLLRGPRRPGSRPAAVPRHARGRDRSDAVRSRRRRPTAVVALVGVGSLFPMIRVSDLLQGVADRVGGRLLVLFPGSFERGNYRLLDARDGWNYLAIPITIPEGASR